MLTMLVGLDGGCINRVTFAVNSTDLSGTISALRVSESMFTRQTPHSTRSAAAESAESCRLVMSGATGAEPGPEEQLRAIAARTSTTAIERMADLDR
jgi:hypothetical protein